MIRTLALASLAAAGFSGAALAADPVTAHSAELTNAAAQNQVHNILASQGYVQITEFGRDDDGRYTAAALKDGKKVFVSVAMPARSAEAPTN